MTIRPFIKTTEDRFSEKESIELDFRPVKGDVLHYEGNRYLIILVEYGSAVNGKQTISIFLSTASAHIS